jgi:hypothetical protein
MLMSQIANLENLKKKKTYRRFMENPDSTSVNVSISIVCTPGTRARNCIRTDWQVAGKRGLSHSSSNHMVLVTSNTIRTRAFLTLYERDCPAAISQPRTILQVSFPHYPG